MTAPAYTPPGEPIHPSTRPCGHYRTGAGYCGNTDNIREYLPGPRCNRHAPAVINAKEATV